MKSILISSENRAPTIATPRDGGGVVLLQGRNRILLDNDELTRLIAAVRPDPPITTTPARARLLAFPVRPREDA